MTQKPKLSVGDRVRVYGHTWGGKHLRGGKGTVENLDTGDGYIGVQLDIKVDDCSGVRVFPQQCRKLRPKQKPEKERERIERWIYSADGFFGAQCMSFTVKPENVGRLVAHRFVLVKPGEVVLSRQELAKAWDTSHLLTGSSQSSAFLQVCEALGLGKDKV